MITVSDNTAAQYIHVEHYYVDDEQAHVFQQAGFSYGEHFIGLVMQA